FQYTATTPTNPLSLHDALPISSTTTRVRPSVGPRSSSPTAATRRRPSPHHRLPASSSSAVSARGRGRSRSPEPATRLAPCWCSRSEEHTSELQSRENLVCRLLL